MNPNWVIGRVVVLLYESELACTVIKLLTDRQSLITFISPSPTHLKSHFIMCIIIIEADKNSFVQSHFR